MESAFDATRLRKVKHRNPKTGMGRQITAACGLLLYLVAFSPVGMAALALLGTLDPDHQALFKPSTDGLSLVLHHGPKCAAHQHGAIARTLTIFSEPASPTDPDHVVSFGNGESLWRNSQPIVSADNSLACVLSVPMESTLRVPTETKAPLPPPDPPDGWQGNLRCLRSTILLI